MSLVYIAGVCQNIYCDRGLCDEDCVCQKNFPDLRICPRISVNYPKVCDMLSGKTGRYCDMDDVECVQNACANGGTCNELHRNTFTCYCPGSYDPRFFCEMNGTGYPRYSCGAVYPTHTGSAMLVSSMASSIIIPIYFNHFGLGNNP